MASLSPTIIAGVAGFYEGLPTAAFITYLTATAAFGVALANAGVSLYEKAQSHFTSRRERMRITQQLKEYSDSGHTKIDTVTLAGIWRGTMEEGDLQRHLYFRMIKAAIDSGEMGVATFRGPTKKADRYTKVLVTEVVSYFKRKGVIE